MAQLKDGTVVNGTITADKFDGIASSANGYSVTNLDSINLDSQTNGMYLCNTSLSITDISSNVIQLSNPISILIENIGSNKFMQTVIDNSNLVYRRIVDYNSPTAYKWKKL